MVKKFKVQPSEIRENLISSRAIGEKHLERQQLERFPKNLKVLVLL